MTHLSFLQTHITLFVLGHGSGSGHHGWSIFDELGRSAARGAGWTMGSALVRHLPIVVIVVALLVVGIVLFLRSRRNKQR